METTKAAGLHRLKELHYQETPLLLGNVWNAQSARVLEKLGFQALGTSSAAVAETLGYRDGEQMSFEEYLFIIKRIRAASTLPLTVDLEAGYSDTVAGIGANLEQLYELGVTGINIEDSVVDESGRHIVQADSFATRLEDLAVYLHQQQLDMFINVRCDAFLLQLPNAREAALQRIAVYEQAGAHGIFLPCITDTEDIKAVVSATVLPVNVMCMPGLPDFDTLRSLGVKRISMGNFINSAVYGRMEDLARRIMQEGSFAPVFS